MLIFPKIDILIDSVVNEILTDKKTKYFNIKYNISKQNHNFLFNYYKMHLSYRY